MNRFDQIIFEELETEAVIIDNINEGIFPLNPMLAYLTLKRNALGKLQDVKDKVPSLKDIAKKTKGKALIAKEKAKAEMGLVSGKGDDATVYKLTSNQKEILSQVYEKYGEDLIKDIMEFRTNVLAPYQLIKRIVKDNKMVTSTDKFGMTHAQFNSAVESGKKKIEKRKEFFGQTDKDKQIKIVELDKAIDALRELKQDYLKTKTLKDTIVNRVLKYYNLGTDDFGDHNLEDLKNTYSELKHNNQILGKILKDKELEGKFDPIVAQDLVRRSIYLNKGGIVKDRQNKVAYQAKVLNKLNPNSVEESVEDADTNKMDLTKSKEFKKNGSFNAALGKYMLRRLVLDDLRVEKNSIYKKTYISIIDKLIEAASERRKKLVSAKVKDRTDIEFNDFERKIWKIKPSVQKEYSGDIDDYIQLIRTEDFSATEYIKRPKKLIDAELKIEAEIKKFERSLKEIISQEDFDKLKKYRLINNLITVRELSNPDKLFKTPEEIKSMSTSSSPDEEDKTTEE